MGKRAALIALVAAAAATVAAWTAAAPASPVAAKEPARLLRFGACSDFLDYMKQNAAPAVSPWGFLDQAGVEAVGPLPPPPLVPPVAAGVISTPARSAPATPKASETDADVSSTNVQEAGIDEPDIAKTNGTSLFAVAGGKLRSVDVSGARPRALDSLPLHGAPQHELLLHENTLIVLSHQGEEVDRVAASSPPILSPPAEPHIQPRPQASTTLTEIDISRPGWMKVVRRLTFPGRYLSARLVKGTARVVFTSRVPNGLSFFRPRSYIYPGEAFERNRAVIAGSRVANWLPSYEIRNVRAKTRTRRFVQCRHVSRPPSFSGFGMLTALTIDLDKGLVPLESDTVLGDGDLVYASEKSLYVATQPWLPEFGFDRSAQPVGQTTSLHRFNVANRASTAYSASGTVSGYLLNQWALSEHEGVLRAATTLAPPWRRRGGSSQSMVVTLREQAGKLLEIGRVAGLGRGERIFGVRFIGDVGYVVTFRETDPLYTIDLSTPARPRLLGELKIPGYSAYLHPAGDNLLLGLGQDVRGDGVTSGTQLSVFDVSDLRKPVRLHRRTIEGALSEAETDHHAFLYWSRSRLAVVPVSVADGFEGVVGFRIGRDKLEEVGRVRHGRSKAAAASSATEAIRRAFVVRGTLLTVSGAGVRATDLRTFADRGWAAFH